MFKWLFKKKGCAKHMNNKLEVIGIDHGWSMMKTISQVFVTGVKKKVLIGSTDKCGTGVNVQTHLVAMHHVDCPWKPSSIEQREGRGIRQGNENKEVAIYRYVTKGRGVDEVKQEAAHEEAPKVREDKAR